MISDCDVPFTPQRQRSQLAVSSKKSVFSPQSNSVSSDRLNFTIFDFEILFFLSFFLNLFIFYFYFWLHWVFVAVHGLSLVAASGGYSLLWCMGFSLRWLLLLRSTGSRCMSFSRCGTQALEHRLSSSAACGIFLGQGSNPCSLHWQADS